MRNYNSRGTSAGPQGYPHNQGVHTIVLETIDYDWQRSQGG